MPPKHSNSNLALYVTLFIFLGGVILVTAPVWLFLLFIGASYLSNIPNIFWWALLPIFLAVFGPRLLSHLPLPEDYQRDKLIQWEIALVLGLFCAVTLLLILTEVQSSAMVINANRRQVIVTTPLTAELNRRLLLPPAFRENCLSTNRDACLQATAAWRSFNERYRFSYDPWQAYILTYLLSFLVGSTATGLYLYYKRE